MGTGERVAGDDHSRVWGHRHGDDKDLVLLPEETPQSSVVPTHVQVPHMQTLWARHMDGAHTIHKYQQCSEMI